MAAPIPLTIPKKSIFWWLLCGCLMIVLLNLHIFRLQNDVVTQWQVTTDNNDNHNHNIMNSSNGLAKQQHHHHHHHHPQSPVSYPILVQNVLLNDIVWVPSQQMIVLMACRPDLFSRPKLTVNVKAQNKFKEYQGIRRVDLSSPTTLQQHLTLKTVTMNNNNDNVNINDNNNDAIQLQSCYEVPSPEVTDFNVRNATFIVQCRYDSDGIGNDNDDEQQQQQQQLVVLYKNEKILANFSTTTITTTTTQHYETTNWNAAQSMQFRRRLLPSTQNIANNNNNNKNDHTFSVSILIKGVFQYSDYVIDVMDYYRKQGISHVYLGVFPMNGDVHAKYVEALYGGSGSDGGNNNNNNIHPVVDFTNFVSMGGMDASAITFTSLGKNGWKLSYLQSALYHSKASKDDMLVVVDIDELLTVPASSTTSSSSSTSSIVSILQNLPKQDSTCYYKVQSNVATAAEHETENETIDDNNNNNNNNINNINNNPNDTPLSRLSPNRCEGGGHAAYFKSIAVLNNCGYVGFHKHGECHTVNGGKVTGEQLVDRNVVTILHFTDFWSKRWDIHKHMQEAAAIAAKANDDKTTNNTTKVVQPLVCNITNEYTTFVRSGVSFSG